MTTPRLPERPHLEQLKRQAKDLLRAARASDPAALARFRALPGLARDADDDHLRSSLALHDAQSVIARELGFASWNALRDEVEERTLDFEASVTEFILAATEGRSDRAARLLARHPRIANVSFHTALLLGDTSAVDAALAKQPELATNAGGPRNWPALLYVCHTVPSLGAEARVDGIAAIARRLLSAGADPNSRFPWRHHGVYRPVLWGAVCVTRLLPLAAALLEAGAEPSDGVTLPLAAGGGDVGALELLAKYDADVDRPWASDGAAPLYAILQWADTDSGIRWLLEHGADADPVFAQNGESPLHVVARRWTVDLAGILVTRGARIDRRRADGRTPYAVAMLNGNRDVAEWLAKHGAVTELTDVDRLVAACSAGERDRAEALVAARPALRDAITDEHYAALYRAAEQDDTRALEAMLACGFDVNHPDAEIGKTALHAAAHEGRADAARVLLSQGADVSARDREFHGQPLVWAADGYRTHPEAGRDYLSVAQLLLAAGSPVDWEPGREPSQEVLDIIADWRAAMGALSS